MCLLDATRAMCFRGNFLTRVHSVHCQRRLLQWCRFDEPSPSCLPLVPAAVEEVTVSNNGRTDFLSVSWRPPAGEVDGYQVTLSDHDRTLHTVSVSKSSPECVFNSLVSGRLYNISISSRSGLHYNHTLVEERTRESSITWTKTLSLFSTSQSHHMVYLHFM